MRVVLIHGSVGNAEAWAPVRPALEERFEVVAPNRGGYPPGPLLERIDFERQAEELAPLLGDGAHLVGHSYGGVIALLIAAAHPERVRSLAVSEPPAFGLARGNPDVDDLVERIAEHFEHGPREPRAFAEGFLRSSAARSGCPSTCRPDSSRASARPWPSGRRGRPRSRSTSSRRRRSRSSSSRARTTPPSTRSATCSRRELGAERAVLPGAGHSLARAPGYPERLLEFLGAAPLG